MRRVGKGFSGVETPLFETMLAVRDIAKDAEAHVLAQGDNVQEHAAEEVATDSVLPPPTSSSPSSPVIPSLPPHQSPCSPQPQDAEGSSLLFQRVLDTCSALVLRVEGLENANVAQQLKIVKLKARVKKLEKLNQVKSSKLRRLKKVGNSQRVESSDDVENVFNQERNIVDMDQDEGIELVTDQEKDVEVEGRHADKQAEIYNIDLDHSLKVLSMQEDDLEVQEAVEVAPYNTIQIAKIKVVQDAAAVAHANNVDAARLKIKLFKDAPAVAHAKEQGDKAENKDKGKSPVVTITGFRDLNKEFKECFNNSSNEVNATGSSVSAAELNFTNSTNVFSADGPSNAAVPNMEDLSHNADDAITYLLLPPVDFQDFPEDTKIETRISLMVTRSIPSIYEAFNSMIVDKSIVALFVDIFGTDAFEVAIEFSVPKYIFFPAAAMTLFYYFICQHLIKWFLVSIRTYPTPFSYRVAYHFMVRTFLTRYKTGKMRHTNGLLHNAKNCMLADGIVINSFKELEGGAIEALQEEQPGKPPIYPVGPLIQAGSVEFSRDVNGCTCLRWLDDQPRESVLYICFGSGGTLSSDQVTELAMGLELNGFLERTKDRGLVVPTWAPQAQILSHGSTGGFLTHGGWNSVLETVLQGVPMIVWPLYAEQKMNALMLTEGLKVALRVKFNEDGIVDRLEIARVVKGLSEGEEGKSLQIWIQELEEAAARVLSKDGCSSVGNKMHKAFPLLVRKFPLPEGTSHYLKKNATARRKGLPLPEVCTAIIVKEKPSIKDDTLGMKNAQASGGVGKREAIKNLAPLGS
nr:hydroquinone glucosyltransferase-like [Tanacetum cinerariifolium]